ncbi:MAG: HlyD family secretion protein [Desulfohalobiaceae bacterium]|nr:HlyD family secretion protein [Desulfohalobiaceae bacterium]
MVPGSLLVQAGDFQTLLVPFALSEQEYTALESTSRNVTLYLPSEALSVPARIERIHPDFDPQTRKRTVELAVSEPNFFPPQKTIHTIMNSNLHLT